MKEKEVISKFEKEICSKCLKNNCDRNIVIIDKNNQLFVKCKSYEKDLTKINKPDREIEKYLKMKNRKGEC
ncbi:MAG: hypothetical protein J6K45_04930 [Clostridia bacterium]|nr:hypothetical protein [Clostridia bacterium]